MRRICEIKREAEEAGYEINPAIHPSLQARQRPGQQFQYIEKLDAWTVDHTTGWVWWPPCASSSSATWWSSKFSKATGGANHHTRIAGILQTQTFSRVWLKGLNRAQHALFYCRQHTSYVTFSHAGNTHSLLHAWLKCWCAFHLIRIVINVCGLIVCSLVIPHLVPFRVFLLFLLLPEP